MVETGQRASPLAKRGTTRPEDTKILEFGCGREKHPGAFGVDWSKDSHADLIHNLEDTPYPLPSDHYTHVYATAIIEHLRDVDAFVREIHRVCAPGATVAIRTPHFSSWYAYSDPTHIHIFGYHFLDLYVHCPSTLCMEPLFEYEHRELVFSRAPRLAGISRLANRYPARYEQLFAFMFPCENLDVRLKALK